MPDKVLTRERYGEAFWRKHHEAWQQSTLNRREYCEAHGIPLKAFGSWRPKFRAEPQPPSPKLLCRRGGGLSHDLCTTIPPAREGRSRKFSEADKRQILEQAMLPSLNLASTKSCKPSNPLSSRTEARVQSVTF
jgi:hypothetical protein